MKNFFDKFYANPWGRLLRRFVIAGASAVVAYLVSTGKLVLSPEGLIDSVLAFSTADVIFSLKLFVGAGFLSSVDKLRREGTWKWLERPVDKPVGEQ
jgi:hypothetical protein